MQEFRQVFSQPGVKKFLKFCITGGLNTAVDLLLYTLLAGGLGVNIYLAQVAGYSAGMLNSYCINRRWTFQSKQRFFGKELLHFIPVNLAILVFSLGILYLFNGVLGWHYILVKLIAVAFTMVFGFLLNRTLVFGKSQ